MNEKKKKPNAFVRILKTIFVHNWDIKLGAIAMGFLFWLLIVIAI